MIENARPRPVGTRGGVEGMRGPCACPRWGATCLLHEIPKWIALPPGQAQGPLPAPHPPLVPTGRVTHRTPFGRQHSSGVQINLSKCIIGLGSASTSHWPINRQCANKLCAYGVLPMLLSKVHHCACLRWLYPSSIVQTSYAHSHHATLVSP